MLAANWMTYPLAPQRFQMMSRHWHYVDHQRELKKLFYLHIPTLCRSKSKPFSSNPDGTLCWWTRAHSERRCVGTTRVLSPFLRGWSYWTTRELLFGHLFLVATSGQEPEHLYGLYVLDTRKTDNLWQAIWITNRQIQCKTEPPWNIFFESLTAEQMFISSVFVWCWTNVYMFCFCMMLNKCLYLLFLYGISAAT